MNERNLILAACIIAVGIIFSGGFYSTATFDSPGGGRFLLLINKFTGSVCAVVGTGNAWECR